MDYSQIPTKIIHLNSIDSTNNYIANLVQNGKVASGTVVLADFQTEGRGQRGTNWQSVSGENIIASLYLDWASEDLKAPFRISMYVALGLCRFLRSYNIEATIKWPNDIMVGNKKMAGVLIENQSRGEKIVSSIIGIGCNVNQSVFPSDIQAISLSQITAKEDNIRIVTLQLIQSIGQIIQQYQNYSFEWLQKSYCNFLYGYNQYIQAIDLVNNSTIEFKINGVEPSGLLQIEAENGEERLVDLKEIKFLM